MLRRQRERPGFANVPRVVMREFLGYRKAVFGEECLRSVPAREFVLFHPMLFEKFARATVADRGSRAERVTKYNYNRELPTQKVLEFLRAQLPQQYELAEIVGKWIWLEFPKASNRAAANTLHRLGFHWNQRRCLWQHPCGAFAPYFVHSGDPRQKFGSRSVSTVNA